MATLSTKALKLLTKRSSDILKVSVAHNIKRQHATWTAPAADKRLLVKDANLVKSARQLELNWNRNISPSVFPFTWLRDNCQCSNCFHPISKSRTVDWEHCDVTISPKHVQVSQDGESVIVNWDDAHCSQFSAEWLHSRSFERGVQQKWLDTYKQRKQIWGSALEQKFPRKRYNYEGLLTNDAALLEWLLELEVRGVALVADAGTDDENAVRRLAERVAFIRRTHYGEEFSVKAKADPSNVAYTGQPLQLHTDLPYYDYKPGVNLLHCLVQSEGEGGANKLVDTLRVALQLRSSYPQHYDALSTTLVDWTDEGQEDGKAFRSLYRAPVICEDWEGNIIRVNYSQPQRDSHFSVALDKVEPWYLALRKFTQLMLSPENSVIYKLKPGELLSFDNLRVCHGRSGYNPASNIVLERHLVGAYLDWDEIRSRIRVLQNSR